jgi:hypothetical protein
MFLKVFVSHQIDQVGFPIDTFESQKNSELLGAGRKRKMKNVEPFPVENFTRFDIFIG